MKCRERIDRRERELARREAVRFVVGIVVILSSLMAAGGLLLFVAAHWDGPRAKTSEELQQLAGIVAGALFVVGLPIAVLTRKESRSDVANQILEEGTRPNANDNFLVRLVVVLALLGVVCGQFMVADAIKSWWVRTKLRGVDRDRAAVILATLVARPEGLIPGELLRHGEPPSRLREMLAYLIATEWADLARDGRHVTLLSPAKRALRH
jgi:hypothetical protein